MMTKEDEENKNAIDVDYQDIKNEIYLTAPQIAKKIDDTDIRVRHWADSFGDLIGIEKLNGRKRYKESDVTKFIFIKDLLDNKNFNHDQVKIYISKHGFQYAKYDSDLVSTKDPLGFQVLASALGVEVDNKLSEFLEKVSEQLASSLKQQQEMNIKLQESIIDKVDEVICDRLDEKELSAKTRDLEMIDLMRNNMEKRKLENDNKGFWSRLLELFGIKNRKE